MKFPKELFVVIEGEGEDTFLNANETVDVLCEINSARQGARYVLQETVTIVNKTETV